MSDRLTPFGFTFGAMEVERLVKLPDGRTALRVRAGNNIVEIYASPTGRSLRVWKNGDGMETK